MRPRPSLILAALLALPATTRAQSAADSSHVRATTPALDSIASALTRYCKTKSASGYVCAVQGNVTSLRRADSALVTPPVVVVTPPPQTDSQPTTTPPDTSKDSTVVVVPPPVQTDTATHDGLAELPRVVYDASYPRQAFQTVRVPAGANLQQYLNMANPGDEIVLSPGATYTGNFVLPVRGSGPAWIVLRTDSSIVLPGTRMTPSAAKANRLAKIVTPNSQPAIATAPSANHWRVVGVEITGTFTASETYSLVALGESASPQTTLGVVPHDLVLDRVYVHGTPTSVLRRCVALNSAASALVDSWLADCHSNNSDSQAAWSCNGPGPYTIANNHLEAGHEIILFGGCDPAIPNLVPSDIVIVGNHFTRPLAWKGVWTSKNILESKNSKRALVEGNVFDHVWASAQIGTWLELKSENQGGGAPWTNTADWTVRYNAVSCVANGINISGHGSNSFASVTTARLSIHDNVISQINTPDCNGAGIQVQLLTGLTDAVIERNTWLVAGSSSKAVSFDGPPTVRLVLRGNVWSRSAYGLIGTGTGEGTATLTKYAPDVTFSNNVLVGAVCTRYPATTACPTALPVPLPTLTAGADVGKVSAMTAASAVAP